ncbi:hypothetical protein BV898_10536 [Hypsibius exemplaris]|uniref:Uncharacterized protein n=1 Tax=Hypsibius exemplaris TaxID=2072580 RepID=A0A1W0WJB9_HYPEX|nr:hypothetical protein BV898_10536 [Hypsibius exemplaris]
MYFLKIIKAFYSRSYDVTNEEKELAKQLRSFIDSCVQCTDIEFTVNEELIFSSEADEHEIGKEEAIQYWRSGVGESGAVKSVETAREFTSKVEEEAVTFPNPLDICSADQSGLQKGMHTGRTLDEQAVRVVEAAVQSMSGFTLSYIYMPILSANGEVKKPSFHLLAGTHRRIWTNCYGADEGSADRRTPCRCLEIREDAQGYVSE